MKFLQYLKETKAELKEVVFPTSSQTIVYTLLVIVISLLVALLLATSDVALKEVIKKIVTL